MLSLLQDEDEKAYLAYSSEGNKVLHLGPLAPDYLTPLPPYQRLFPGQAREAPAIFKSGDLYLMFTSGMKVAQAASCPAAASSSPQRANCVCHVCQPMDRLQGILAGMFQGVC